MLIEAGAELFAIEIKSGQTVADDFFVGLDKFSALLGTRRVTPILIYGGDKSQSRTKSRVLAWSDIQRFEWIRGTGSGKRARGSRKSSR